MLEVVLIKLKPLETSLSSYTKFVSCTFSQHLTRLKMSTTFTSAKPIEESIRSKLKTELQTSYLNIINESYMHNVPKGAETHFKVIVVSNIFKNLPLIKRHRMVNELLNDEFQSGLHALSIVAKTPDQWAECDKNIEPSPNCRGGFGK